MQFAHPAYLWFLLLLVPYVVWYIWNRNRKHATISVSTIAPYVKNGRPLRAWLLHGLFVMRALCLAALIVILARPQAYDRWSTSNTQGTDIVIALDISTSMLARDFKPDRFEAGKRVALLSTISTTSRWACFRTLPPSATVWLPPSTV